MLTHILGYPRIGDHREMKKANEAYWGGKITAEELNKVAFETRSFNLKLQKAAGIDWIPCNDFSYYDHVLDMCLMTGSVPDRFQELKDSGEIGLQDLYFAMARGYQKSGFDIPAMEMTKWFDTNYHYIVPEFRANQDFTMLDDKVVREYKEAVEQKIQAMPVLLGPVSFLLSGKEKEEGFYRLDLLDKLLRVYMEIIGKLVAEGATFIQMDEPYLSLNPDDETSGKFQYAYEKIRERFPQLKVVVAGYFDCYGKNLKTVLDLPVHTVHLDLSRCPEQLDDVLTDSFVQSGKHLSLGIVDGRNIWKNDYDYSLGTIKKAMDQLGAGRLWIATSCSLLHSPCDLQYETNLPDEIKQWLAFARQKLDEVVDLKKIAGGEQNEETDNRLNENRLALQSRKSSSLIHSEKVKQRVTSISPDDINRNGPFSVRREKQKQMFGLPEFPTTTIGSFPQTKEVRSWRAQWKKKEISDEQYKKLLREEIERTVRWQEDIGLDVLVHGEFERNDMVEYFGEQLAGFAFTKNGWVQSYGSRCVKPPIIFGDVYRPHPMTVEWSAYAQSLTKKWMKGMLTGPVTILQWSFVRDDQPLRLTCEQIALAIHDEVLDLESAGIRIIQIDEPAIREGLPLKKEHQKEYLDWAIRCFRIASSGVKDETQIHTHMCYSEFNDIIDSIAEMDADVITIETSRSQMELLDAFAEFHYPNEIGPGVYDIHSPRIPAREEMVQLLEKAGAVIPPEQLWVNPDCGLKTRKWEETKAALTEMVKAAEEMRRA